MHRALRFSIPFLWIIPTFCLAQRNHDTTLVIHSSNPLTTALDKKIDAEIRRAFKREKLVGLTVGVVNNGQTTFYGYGETKKGNGQVPDQRTIFEIGSI